MQGKLSEIDIRSILQLIELGQRTGELFVEAYSMPVPSPAGESTSGSSNVWKRPKHPVEKSWLVFFLNGKIVYAGDANPDLRRLRHYLRHYRLAVPRESAEASMAIATTNAPEYGHLWALIENHVLSPAQGRAILQRMVQETLFDLLSLHQGAFIFELSPPLAPQLETHEIGVLVPNIIQQVQEWRQFHPLIQSPDQCPAIADTSHLRSKISESALTAWLDGKTSIRQLARFLNQNIVAVARRLYPYLERGDLQLQAPQHPASQSGIAPLQPPQDRLPRVVCIDDGATIRKTVEFILNENGYEGTAISNPLKALSLVFQLKPDLILCDISMPELDGYEICAMLRKSTAFRQTPIIMLTGRDGFIDRVRARMVGATDYLTKPFGAHELLTLVERYVGPGNPDQPEPEKLLAEALENELEIGITSEATASSTPNDSGYSP